ncbi:lasso peptide biosynthesis B2 protein [uncultured Sphingomonas sp.]|uniref:lasso peptide biosynthesis B2 protein n=1 Tax=uncultured Sphingomonas sp. TaxID=158754 RepID=UPI00260EF127|nr:lasso peptide biosynthesis B2 protein [uncultured Sphingomonas sp.]
MCFALAPGISFCDAGGRHLFLDLPNDRYFCLESVADRAFAALVSGAVLDSDTRARLDRLRQSGLLVAGRDGARPHPCPPAGIGAAPLDGEELPRVGAAAVARAAFGLARAKLELRRRPLHQLCATFGAAKAALSPHRRPDPQELAALAAAFHAAGRIVGALDQCLALSLAIARRALASGFPADLLLGVRLRPFQAHAWVLIDGVLISDRQHVVRPFTPILIL